MEPGDSIDLINAINFNLSNVQEIFDLLKSSSQDTNRCLLNECDIIYECRTCNNLFRSLANFVSHKRHFCQEHKCEEMMAFGVQNIPVARRKGSQPAKEEEEEEVDEDMLSCKSSSSTSGGNSESDEESSSSDHESTPSRASDLEEELTQKEEEEEVTPPLSDEMNEEESIDSSREDEKAARVAEEDMAAHLEQEKMEVESEEVPEEPKAIVEPSPTKEASPAVLTPPSPPTPSSEAKKDVPEERSPTKAAASTPSPTKIITVVTTTSPSALTAEVTQAAVAAAVQAKDGAGTNQSVPKNVITSQTTIAIDSKVITNSLGKTFKNCTLKLPRGIMEKLFVPVDSLAQEGGDPAKRNQSGADNKADGSKPSALSKYATGKKFAILNPSLFAKLIKENSKPLKIQTTTTTTTAAVPASVDPPPQKVVVETNNHQAEEKNSQEPIKIKVSKVILENAQQDVAKTAAAETAPAAAPTTSPSSNQKAANSKTPPSSNINGLPTSSETTKPKLTRSSSCDSDDYGDIKRLFIDSDAENSLSDAEEDKQQEKKPLIVVISKSPKEQQMASSLKNEANGDVPKRQRAYTCEHCKGMFLSKKSLDNHTMTVHERKRLMYPCPFCEATLGQAWSVMRHIMAIHKRPKEEYDSLKKIIKKDAYYKDIDPNEPVEYEEGESHPIGSLKCYMCYKPFDKKNALATHIRYCSKSISKPNPPKTASADPAKNASTDFPKTVSPDPPKNLSPASPAKEDAKEVVAASSPKNTNSTLIDANLNVHSRPKRAPSKKEFKDYINSQTLKLNYISKAPPIPPKASSSKPDSTTNHNSPVTKQFSMMEASMMEIINLQKLECLRCKKTFNNTSNLKRHAASHFGWCRFGCGSCNYKTYNKSDCKMHILKTHKEEEPEKLIITLSDFKTKVSTGGIKLTDSASSSPLGEGSNEPQKRPAPEENQPSERKKKRKSSQTFRSIPADSNDLAYHNFNSDSSPLKVIDS
ncbi:SERINC3 [Cordylochernes scorpioides]|uniref:SERINC3 n=1 Tax=Cordylochernes scorpioides TaxID=51811 RepID=A0ABY6L1C8_9ARAC|nr:SERINC3 [Cordylochernes scorpioides]